MQDEINEKAINIAVRVSKLTAAELKKAIGKLLADMKKEKEPKAQKTPKQQKKPELKHGKQTLKQLSKHNDGLSTMELKDPNLRLLCRAMRTHNVDFAAVKDGKGKYTLFFKGKDADSITHAFNRYVEKTVKLANRKPPIQKLLAAAKAAAQTLNKGRDKEKNRSKGARDR